ncbi:MAG: hypothetical protein IKH28_14835 [Lachnospiraceae bacterium]|nr:hypothetical protein [Lachnospiraceae bacterium]
MNILSNSFPYVLYDLCFQYLLKLGMADLVKSYFAQLSSGIGAVEQTLKKYLN